MALSRLVPVALAGVLMSACTSFQAYEGPARPASEVAEIKGSYRIVPLLLVNFFFGNQLQTVDGKRAKGAKARVLPGPHLVTFGPVSAVILAGYGGGGVIGLGSKRQCAFVAESEAGHRYTLPVGSVSVTAAAENTPMAGVMQWKDLAPHRWFSDSQAVAVWCSDMKVTFCSAAITCPAKDSPTRCDLPQDQPVGVCVPATP